MCTVSSDAIRGVNMASLQSVLIRKQSSKVLY